MKKPGKRCNANRAGFCFLPKAARMRRTLYKQRERWFLLLCGRTAIRPRILWDVVRLDTRGIGERVLTIL